MCLIIAEKISRRSIGKIAIATPKALFQASPATTASCCSSLYCHSCQHLHFKLPADSIGCSLAQLKLALHILWVVLPRKPSFLPAAQAAPREQKSCVNWIDCDFNLQISKNSVCLILTLVKTLINICKVGVSLIEVTIHSLKFSFAKINLLKEFWLRNRVLNLTFDPVESGQNRWLKLKLEWAR